MGNQIGDGKDNSLIFNDGEVGKHTGEPEHKEELISQEELISEPIDLPTPQPKAQEVKKAPAIEPLQPLPYKDKEEVKSAKHKKTIRNRVIFGVIAAFVGIIVGVVAFAYWYKDYLLSKVTYETTGENIVITIVNESGETVALSDVTESTEHEIIEEEHIQNFLLIGIDSRSRSYTSNGKGSRADVIMIMSVDTEAKTIKLVSVARDSYAYYPGYSTPGKINAAMNYGGPALLQATIENQLRITIDGYAYVNFYNMASIINAVGGVYVDMTSGERKVANDHLNALYHGEATNIEATGNDTWINGQQAVAYARIRYVGNGDYERMERQVEVLQSLLNQFMAMSSTGKLSVMDDILSCIVTNIPQEDIEKYVFDFLPSLDDLSIQYLQLPIDGCYNAGMYGNEWSIRANWNAMIPYVQEFFYGETTAFDEVKLPKHAPSFDRCHTDIPLEDLVSDSF
ncbi:MAG: LCP family protein [Saccharofermentans sp.]|nr:LCP family protein [Saccharofermentans sp.]